MEDQMQAMYPCFSVQEKQIFMVDWYFLMVVWYLLYDGLVFSLWWLIYSL